MNSPINLVQARSPIQQAAIATLWAALVGVCFRYGYALLDPEFRSWALVALAPLLGLGAYVRATGRNPFPPELMIAVGYLGLLVYGRGFLRDGFPGPTVEWILWGLVVALPLGLILWGVALIRRRGPRDGSIAAPSGE